MVPNKQITDNFNLHEFLHSSTAERSQGLVDKQFNPPHEVIAALEYQIRTLWQPLRTFIGAQISIESGYRCPEVNKLVGGAPTSQHQFGQAGDVHLTSEFLTNSKYTAVKEYIDSQVLSITGKAMRKEVNADFYLFCYVCINLQKLDIDQVIHEFGRGPGNPAWVHGSASKEKNKRQILIVSTSGTKVLNLKEALSLGV